MPICTPNVWAMTKENLDFAHPFFELILIIAHPILVCFQRHCPLELALNLFFSKWHTIIYPGSHLALDITDPDSLQVLHFQLCNKMVLGKDWLPRMILGDPVADLLLWGLT